MDNFKEVAVAAAGIIITILIVVAVFAASWIVTCGFVKGITLCFGWGFSWARATGIWLVLLLAKWVFTQHSGSKE